MRNVDWRRVEQYATDACSDLGIPEARGKLLVQLWKTCPDCVPVDAQGNPSAAVVRAYVKDIDAKKDIACTCQPYAVTQPVLQAATADYATQSDLGQSEIPFGWGWLRFDARGQPLVVTKPAPVCIAPAADPHACDAPAGNPPPPAPTPGKPGAWRWWVGGTLAVIGAAALIVYAQRRAAAPARLPVAA
jgi:hypothetical protein